MKQVLVEYEENDRFIIIYQYLYLVDCKGNLTCDCLNSSSLIRNVNELGTW